MKRILSIGIILAFLISGCATAPKNTELQDVAQTAQAREVGNPDHNATEMDENGRSMNASEFFDIIDIMLIPVGWAV